MRPLVQIQLAPPARRPPVDTTGGLRRSRRGRSGPKARSRYAGPPGSPAVRFARRRWEPRTVQTGTQTQAHTMKTDEPSASGRPMNHTTAPAAHHAATTKAAVGLLCAQVRNLRFATVSP